MSTEQYVKDLKIDRKYFLQVADRRKLYEIRFNDRKYEVDDILALKDYENGQYQDRFLLARVDYIINDFEGLKDGYVCLGITLLSDIISDMTGIFRTYEAVTNI